MGWADHAIEILREGKDVEIRPRGNSMRPLIKSGDRVAVAPIDDETVISKGDIVLCVVKGSQYVHLVKAVDGGRYQIGNNRGRINGWIGRGKIYGIVTAVGD